MVIGCNKQTVPVGNLEMNDLKFFLKSTILVISFSPITLYGMAKSITLSFDNTLDIRDSCISVIKCDLIVI